MIRRLLSAGLICMALASPALAQEGQMLTDLENQINTAANGWQDTIMTAARSLFWTLAGIEIGLGSIWLALQAASLDRWFSELVQRILYVGFFAFVLQEGPGFAKAIVDSLYQIGAQSGSASPAAVFDAGLRVASQMSQQARFGVFEDNALAIAAVLSMVVVVICFSLVAAVFVSVMVEMYVGLLAGMIMLGLGGSSHTKDFATRYLIYAFAVGMKLMTLVMIASIGSNALINLAQAQVASDDQYLSTLTVAGASVVIFLISIYVPNIIQGVVQGASVTGGMETIRHGTQAASFVTGAGFLATNAARTGLSAAQSARAGGSSLSGSTIRGVAQAIGSAARASGSAAKDKAIGSPGAYAGSLLGLANAKLDQHRTGRAPHSSSPPKTDL